MPQMKPLYWLAMLTFTSMFVMSLLTIMHFTFSPISLTLTTPPLGSIPNSNSWHWKW